MSLSKLLLISAVVLDTQPKLIIFAPGGMYRCSSKAIIDCIPMSIFSLTFAGSKDLLAWWNVNYSKGPNTQSKRKTYRGIYLGYFGQYK
jgi:hypothetical protein